MTATLTARRQHADAPEFSPADVQSFITARGQIAEDMKAHLGIEIEREQVIPCRTGQIALPTQTDRRQDKESAQFPEDEVQEPLFTRMADGEISEAAPPPFSIAPDPAPVADGAREDDAPATQTGRRQDQEESLQFPADAVDEPAVTRAARPEVLEALAAQAKVKLGLAPDSDAAREDDAPATQTGRRQDQEESLQIPADAVDEPTLTREARCEMLEALAAQAKARLGIAPDPAEATQTGRRPGETATVLTADESVHRQGLGALRDADPRGGVCAGAVRHRDHPPPGLRL